MPLDLNTTKIIKIRSKCLENNTCDLDVHKSISIDEDGKGDLKTKNLPPDHSFFDL